MGDRVGSFLSITLSAGGTVSPATAETAGTVLSYLEPPFAGVAPEVDDPSSPFGETSLGFAAGSIATMSSIVGPGASVLSDAAEVTVEDADGSGVRLTANQGSVAGANFNVAGRVQKKSRMTAKIKLETALSSYFAVWVGFNGQAFPTAGQLTVQTAPALTLRFAPSISPNWFVYGHNGVTDAVLDTGIVALTGSATIVSVALAPKIVSINGTRFSYASLSAQPGPTDVMRANLQFGAAAGAPTPVTVVVYPANVKQF